MSKLSLCIIVGSNEATELERCLKSVQGSLFDEIIVTTTQDDAKVEAVAKKYASKVSFFKWIHNFSAARNFCFSQASGDHIMWLDADDEVTPENILKLLEMKPHLKAVDCVLMSYNYAHHPDGRPLSVLSRERIVRNSSEFTWVDPIHEYIQTPPKCLTVDRSDVAIDHRRTRDYDSSRNLDILKRTYESGKATPRNIFYYGKDLFEAGGKEKEGATIIKEFLDLQEGSLQDRAIACLRLYTYCHSKGDMLTAEQYLTKMEGHCSDYAEPHYLLGLIEKKRGNTEEALSRFELALSKKVDGLFGAKTVYYDKYPLIQLVQTHYASKNYTEALKYSKQYLELFPDDKDYIYNTKMLTDLVAKEGVETPEVEMPQVAWLEVAENPNDPSQRIRRLNVHEEMVNQGLPSKIVYGYRNLGVRDLLALLGDISTVICPSFTEQDHSLLKNLKNAGFTVISDINEDILNHQNVLDTLNIADGVVACSKTLMGKVKPHSSLVKVIEDAVEPADEEYDYFAVKKPVALYMGMGGNSFLVTDYLKDVIAEAGYELKVCTEWEDADHTWTLDSWQRVMREASVVLCPQRVDVQPAKSNIKAAQAMELGLPVIASNLPAYTEFIEHGINGFICETLEDWKEALISCKKIEKRIQVGMNGKDTSSQFSIQEITGKWVRALKALSTKVSTPAEVKPPAKAKVKETVPIIIPVYKGVAYLKMCISSIHRNTQHPYHIVLSDAGSDEETWKYLDTLKGITVVGSRENRLNFSQAVNAGVKASGGSRFFTVLNSDVIVSKGWLTKLVGRMETTSRLAVCGVLSNCDSGWLFNNGKADSQSIDMQGYKPGMVIDEIKPELDKLESFMSASNKAHEGSFVEQAWVAYYSSIYARSAWNVVGDLDPAFENGCEDLDHCKRIKAMGYRIGQAYDSFVFHFGGISRGAYQIEDKEVYDEKDIRNHKILSSKWEKEEIVIYTGPAWEKWDSAKVMTGMAGSETWAAELASEFSHLGYKVSIFGDPEKDVVDADGVQYFSYKHLEEYLKYRVTKLTILSRTCDPARTMNLKTGKIQVMVHDIWVSSDPTYPMVMNTVDSYGVLSEWHQNFFQQHHGVPKSKTFITHNGVRGELYKRKAPKKNKTVYSSSPDRGLKTLLELLPEIRKEVPDFEIDVAYGFLNWESMAKHKNNQEALKQIAELKELMKQPGVNILGRVSKEELAKKQIEAKIWAYPTAFTETFCITAVENGLAGNAIVTTPLGGLTTTLEGTDSFAQGKGEEYKKDFVSRVVNLLKDEDARKANAIEVLKKVKGYTWKSAAAQWLGK